MKKGNIVLNPMRAFFLTLLITILLVLNSSLHASHTLSKGLVFGTIAQSTRMVLKHEKTAHWNSRQRLGLGVAGFTSALLAYQHISKSRSCDKVADKIQEKAECLKKKEWLVVPLEFCKLSYNWWRYVGKPIALVWLLNAYVPFPQILSPQVTSSRGFQNAVGSMAGSMIHHLITLAFANYNFINSGSLDPVSTKDTNFSTIALSAVPAEIQNMAKALKKGLKPNHMLLYGPTGTGKTLYVLALAGETKTPLFVVERAHVTSRGHDKSYDHFLSIMKSAQLAALNSPTNHSIIFLDEADSLAPNRKEATSQETASFAGWLATQISPEHRTYPNVVFMAATNYRDRVESVLWRDGRMQPLKVSLPTKEQLVEVYSKTIQRRMEKFYTPGVNVSQYDVHRLAQFSENQSSAFVDRVVYNAILAKKIADQDTPPMQKELEQEIRMLLKQQMQSSAEDSVQEREAKKEKCEKILKELEAQL